MEGGGGTAFFLFFAVAMVRRVFFFASIFIVFSPSRHFVFRVSFEGGEQFFVLRELGFSAGAAGGGEGRTPFYE